MLPNRYLSKVFLSLVTLLLLNSSSTQGQTLEHQNAGYFGFNSFDYYSPRLKKLADRDDVVTGLTWGYDGYLSKAFDIMVRGHVTEVNYFMPIQGKQRRTSQQIDIKIKGKPLGSERFITPYLTGGFGLAWVKDLNTDLHGILGVGSDIRITPRLVFNLGAEYRKSVGVIDEDSYLYGVGLKFLWGGDDKPKTIEKPAATIPPPPPPLDSDQDGIIDTEDQCPNAAGLPSLSGCPDFDGDGVADPDDKCPQTAGPVTNEGCPEEELEIEPEVVEEEVIPDPVETTTTTTPPVREEIPSPPPPREEVKPAIIVNEMVEKEAATLHLQNLLYDLNVSTIKPASIEILNRLIVFLKANPEYKVSFVGHSDTTGRSGPNMILSTRRAEKCKIYLVDRGIDAARVDYSGRGETNPLGNNRFSSGRKVSRRVEINLYK